MVEFRYLLHFVYLPAILLLQVFREHAAARVTEQGLLCRGLLAYVRAMRSSSIAVCACKGIRKCAVCEEHIIGKSHDLPLPSFKQQYEFVYDATTNRAELLGGMDLQPLWFPFPGVLVYDDFITTSEEEELVSLIDSNPWKESQSGRRKQDYGPKVNFKRKKVKFGTFNGLPEFMQTIVERLKGLPKLSDFSTVELCNLEYVPTRGSSIDPHYDDNWLWGERLVTLNLLSDTKLTMTCHNQSNNSIKLENCLSDLNARLHDLCVKVPLNRRSIVVLFGPARYTWMHGIERSDITSRRLCCTFRELSNEFMSGSMKTEGQKLLAIASSFAGDVVT